MLPVNIEIGPAAGCLMNCSFLGEMFQEGLAILLLMYFGSFLEFAAPELFRNHALEKETLR